MWHSGIDQHKPYSVITTYGPDGPRVTQAPVPNLPAALQGYFAAFPGKRKRRAPLAAMEVAAPVRYALRGAAAIPPT